MSDLPTPITRSEQYLSRIAGAEPTLPTPITREERYLAKIAGENVDIPPAPITRTEQYLAQIVENGSGVEVESLSVTENITYTAPEGKAYSPVTVNVPNSYTAGDEGKVVSSGALVAQTATSTSTNGTIDTTLNNSVTVNVPTGTARTSADLTASGATVNVPAGLYASAASKSIASGSATTPATTLTAVPAISVSSGGLITAAVSASQNVTPTVSAGYVSSGTAGAITVNGSTTQQLTAKAAQTYTPTTSAQTIASGQYLTGAQTIAGDANLVAGNIKDGVSIFGVTGTHKGGGGYELLYEWDLTLQTTTTSESTVATYSVNLPLSNPNYINACYCFVVRDKAGVRNGYYTGNDTKFRFDYLMQGATETYSISTATSSYWRKADGTYYWTTPASMRMSLYGIYLAIDSITPTSVKVYARYNSNYTGTINGTYNMCLYKMPLPPHGNPANYSFT